MSDIFDHEAKDQCPTCNSPVIIVGHTTKYFVPDVSKEKEDNIMLAARNVQLNQQIKEAKAKISELKKILFTAYCWGYERGHNDTVEGSYSPPAEYPEEWPEIQKEIELMEEDYDHDTSLDDIDQASIDAILHPSEDL